MKARVKARYAVHHAGVQYLGPCEVDLPDAVLQAHQQCVVYDTTPPAPATEVRAEGVEPLKSTKGSTKRRTHP
jgi:hypothetical protein